MGFRVYLTTNKFLRIYFLIKSTKTSIIRIGYWFLQTTSNQILVRAKDLNLQKKTSCIIARILS